MRMCLKLFYKLKIIALFILIYLRASVSNQRFSKRFVISTLVERPLLDSSSYKDFLGADDLFEGSIQVFD